MSRTLYTNNYSTLYLKRGEKVEKPEYYNNPYTKNVIFGARLQAGDRLKVTDIYASTSGEWEVCPCPGVVLGKTDTLWIRPQTS